MKLKQWFVVAAAVISFAVVMIIWNWANDWPVQIVIDEEALAQTLVTEPEADIYELAVIGGEPEGVAAAVSAARNGVKTLLIEHRDGLGGLFTYGWLNYLDIPRGRDGQTLSRGIFSEWHKLVGNRDGFSIERAKKAFLSMAVNEPNLTLMLNTSLVDVQMNKEGSLIEHVRVKNEQGQHVIKAKRYIDATQDADLAAMAGVPYFVGQQDLGFDARWMAVTPIIKVLNVNWSKIKKAGKKGILGGADVNDDVAWGFVELHDYYQPAQDNIRLRGLNIVRVKEENTEVFYINALHIFGVDVLNEESKREALQKGLAEFEHILAYLKEELPGFENATIGERPTEMYVRESRHILAEYQLQVSDLWRNRDHWDSIGYGGYPADIQATSMTDLGFVAVNPDRYAIPFRSLVPLKVDNLLVAGRSAGYSSLAAGSARIVPTGMVTGEAAGAAAALSLDHDVDFRTMSKDHDLIEKLREKLAEQGAWVDHFEADYKYKGEFYEDAVLYLMDHTILPADYNNELYVDEPMHVKIFANLLLNGYRQSPNPSPPGDSTALNALYGTPNDQMHYSRDSFAQLIVKFFADEQVERHEAWDRALQLNLIDEWFYNKVNEDRVMTRGEGYYMIAHLLKHVVNGI